MLRNFDAIDHEKYMRVALKEAKLAGMRGDRPIGAVIMHDGNIIARSSNRFKTLQSHVAHAENTAILACAPYLKQHSRECVIYSTVEPCIMCSGALVLARIRHIIFGARDEKFGGCGSIFNIVGEKRLNHQIEITAGVMEKEAASLMKSFFERKRKKDKKN